MKNEVYSICFMCTVRCPIKVLVANDDVVWIQGNPHVAGIEGALCAKGSAGLALLHDSERPQYPMIRLGARGAGQWKKASWDEALDFVAAKLKEIIDKHGPQSLVFGERTNLNTHISKTFMKALGSPNHFTHDALCKGSVNTAFRSLTGYTDAEVSVDYANTRHIVMYGRNIFEALEIKPINNLLDAMEKGAKLTYIDPRVSVTATKAQRYWQIRPGTDLALNYALIHTILKEKLYDADYVAQWVSGLAELQAFVAPCTPQWAEQETGIPAGEIAALARETAEVKPAVIFHYGYRGAHHTYEIYMRRSIIILNALMGSIEAKGGLFFKKGPKAAGRGEIGKYVNQKFSQKSDKPRFDGSGREAFPIADSSHGNPQRLAHAILNEDPYPIKAAIINRFEPLGSIADSGEMRRALDKLDLLVAIDINYSEIAWYADVILPESVYLERADSIMLAPGLKPQLFMRRQAVSPRYETRPSWLILKELANRLGVGQYFQYESIEDIWNFQLKDMGVKIEDFDAKGFVALTDKTLWWGRDELKFKTPSGKIELVSSLLEQAGFPSFPPYTPVPAPPPDSFKMMVGRCAAHTHVSTQNNFYLHELVPENELWINAEPAARLGIKDGAYVEVVSPLGTTGRIKAKVTDFIHPEAVFMLHGFGKTVPAQTRCYLKGASDASLQENLSDKVGGSPAYDDNFVQVRPMK
jgi:thiosulfate reductase/polysulfide reductase chain A